jgi:hypothetical protein
MLELWSVLEYRKDRLINWAAARVLMFDTLDKKKWRKCMGIEPTRDGISAPHRI